MRFVQETHRKRQAARVGELLHRERQSLEVVGDLSQVLGGMAFRDVSIGRFGFGGQQVDERGACSLDLGRENRFLADEGVEEPVQRRNHGSRDLQPCKRTVGRPTPLPELPREIQGGRIRRQVEWHEGLDLLPPDLAELVPAGSSGQSQPHGTVVTDSFPIAHPRNTIFTTEGC